VARRIGGWLEGPRLPRDQPPGVRLGLPARGPGSVAGFAPRLAAYLIDAFTANLIVGISAFAGVRIDATARGWLIYLVFLLEELVLVSAAGQTLGMRFLGLRVIRLADLGRPAPRWVLGRTVLLGLFIPAVIWDRDGRGLHDRASGTAVVRDPTTVPRPAPAAPRPAPAPGAAGRSRATPQRAGSAAPPPRPQRRRGRTRRR
jgi:uncharacterized RDD family membrane protein YckC